MEYFTASLSYTYLNTVGSAFLHLGPEYGDAHCVLEVRVIHQCCPEVIAARVGHGPMKGEAFGSRAGQSLTSGTVEPCPKSHLT